MSTLAASLSWAVGEDRKLVLIAGKPSHPPLMHEFRAGCLLLQSCLSEVEGLTVEVHDQGWVKDDAVLTDADAVVIFADGGGRHPAIQDDRLKTLEALISKGMGFGCMHYGVEVPVDKGAKELTAWIGGRYEHMFSCNPIWEPEFKELPKHDGMSFTPILIGKPSDDVRDGPYVYPKGPYEHILSSKGRMESMLWVVERADGGRGFGFTGGHFHINWGNDAFRKVVLNTMVWLAKADVPENGVVSSVTQEQLHANLDKKK